MVTCKATHAQEDQVKLLLEVQTKSGQNLKFLEEKSGIFSVTGLVPGTKYQLVIRAKNTQYHSDKPCQQSSRRNDRNYSNDINCSPSNVFQHFRFFTKGTPCGFGLCPIVAGIVRSRGNGCVHSVFWSHHKNLNIFFRW